MCCVEKQFSSKDYMVNHNGGFVDEIVVLFVCLFLFFPMVNKYFRPLSSKGNLSLISVRVLSRMIQVILMISKGLVSMLFLLLALLKDLEKHFSLPILSLHHSLMWVPLLVFSCIEKQMHYFLVHCVIIKENVVCRVSNFS